MREQWKDVPGYEGLYRVSNMGNVRGMRRGKILKPATTTKGYLYLGLSKDGVVRQMRVHRIVALAFIGEPPKGGHTRHLNGVKTDNRAANLKYGTQLDNDMDNYHNGLYSHPPITDKGKQRARELLLAGAKLVEIASELGVTKATISRVKCLMRREARSSYNSDT